MVPSLAMAALLQNRMAYAVDVGQQRLDRAVVDVHDEQPGVGVADEQVAVVEELEAERAAAGVGRCGRCDGRPGSDATIEPSSVPV